jgi:enhancing lycopene biosynthesis protein 2
VSCKTDSDLESIFTVFIEKILSNDYINHCKGIQLTDERNVLIDKKIYKNKLKKCCL